MTLTLDALNRMGPAEFAAAIGDTFELAPWVAEGGGRQAALCQTVTALHEAMMGAVRAAPRERQLEFLRGHPDLAGKAARAGAMTDDSKREQASVGLDSLGEEEFARFHRLNDAYKAKFGFPFIDLRAPSHARFDPGAVRAPAGRTTPATEFAAALQEVFFITRLRVAAQGDGRGHAGGERPAQHPCARHPCRPSGGRRRDRALRVRRRKSPSYSVGYNECRRPHRPAADRRPAVADRPLRTALRRRQPLSQQGYRRAAIRPSSTSCLCAFPSPSRRGIITSHCSARPGATRPIAEVKRRKE